MPFLPPELYDVIERSMPILCVDFVPVRHGDAGAEVGLIRRYSPFGEVWCHLGGRVQRGETLTAAIQRHARATLDVDVDLLPNAQPHAVYEWFPPDLAPNDGTVHGDDPRKHSVGLSYVVELRGEPRPHHEALDFRFFAPDALPVDLWPGAAELLARLLQAR